jgi:type III restriction enzyme
MTEDTEKADEVAEYLEQVPDLTGRVLCIHTDKFDNISKKEEDRLRQAAREIDTNEYHAIVSVMMLKEGWDVKNVTVIVGLRAFSTKAEILPEQTVGRGLRRIDGPIKRDETLDIIGNDKFISIVNNLEKEGVAITHKNIGKEPVRDTEIEPDKKKKEFNIKIPLITQRYVPSAGDLAERLKLENIPKPDTPISLKEKGQVTKIIYKGWDATKLAEAKKQGRKIREEFKKEYSFYIIKKGIDAVNYFTKAILKNAKLPHSFHFHYVAPLIQDYIQDVLFEEKVELDNPEVINKLNEEDVQDWTLEAFAEAIRAAVKKPKPVKVKEERFIDLLETDKFIWDGSKAFPAKKTVFNMTPFDNNFEKDFVIFLDSAKDVRSFAKLIHWKTDFRLEYFGVNGGLRHYYPDFVAIASDGSRYLIETKGFLDEDANFKKARAIEWCHDVSILSEEKWEYLFVRQELFEKDVYKTIDDLKNALSEEEKSLFLKPILSEIDESLKYTEYLPVYSFAAAAGKFGEGADVNIEGWMKADIGRKLNKKMFIAKIVGSSMEPLIQSNNYCVFSADVVGSRQGKIILAQHHDVFDIDTRSSYTVKRYKSEKRIEPDGTWRHEKITLEPLNREYDPIILPKCLEGEFKIIAEFVSTL